MNHTSIRLKFLSDHLEGLSAEEENLHSRTLLPLSTKRYPTTAFIFGSGGGFSKLPSHWQSVIDKSVTGFVIERTRGVSNLTNIAKNYLFGFYGVFRILRKTILGVSNIAKNFLSGSVVNSRKLVV